MCNCKQYFKQHFQIEDGPYRYVLGRVIQPPHHDKPNRTVDDKPNKSVCFIMLNPSTADDKDDDDTMDEVIKYAKEWGYSHLTVVNLFAYRESKSDKLASLIELCPHIDPVGPNNNYHIWREVAYADKTIIAWGGGVRRINRAIRKKSGAVKDRDQEVLEFIADITDPYCLCKIQKNSKEYPAHPSRQSPYMPMPPGTTPSRWAEAPLCRIPTTTPTPAP